MRVRFQIRFAVSNHKKPRRIFKNIFIAAHNCIDNNNNNNLSESNTIVIEV